MTTEDNTDADFAGAIDPTVVMFEDRASVEGQEEDSEVGSLSMHPLKVGDVVGKRYQLTGVIGQGGMGRVFAAHHLSTNAKVAVKTISGDRLGSPRAAKRFELEARHTASLSHPNIVKVFDYGKQDDILYLVMEFIEGSSLSSIIDIEGRLPWKRVFRILQQVLMALVA
ncbi:MAG: serine/threonine-protein kinase, partial [Pseudomonadota bacterium]